MGATLAQAFLSKKATQCHEVQICVDVVEIVAVDGRHQVLDCDQDRKKIAVMFLYQP
jgi:hypothetical protein